jgi:uncharacterized LabA/DUF88 family protein
MKQSERMDEDKKCEDVKEEKVYKDPMSLKEMIFPGSLFRLPDDFQKVVVFIDNAYLIRLKNYFFKDSFKYFLRVFVEKLAKKNEFIVEDIYLYDSPPFQSRVPSDEEKRKRDLYNQFIKRFIEQGINVREGRCQKIRIGNDFVYCQKGVDMLLGIDMVGAPVEYPYVNKLILLSGDSDFVPVVEKLLRQNIIVILWTYFERKRDSPFSRCNELLKCSSRYIKINKQDFINAQIKGGKNDGKGRLFKE